MLLGYIVFDIPVAFKAYRIILLSLAGWPMAYSL
jgi:hypothetical protein